MMWCVRTLVSSNSVPLWLTAFFALNMPLKATAYELHPPVVPPQPLELIAQQPQITNIDVLGSTILTEEQLAPIIKPLEGKDISLQQLQEVAKAITQIYINQGYLSSRAVVPEQDFANGVGKILVIEGYIQEITIKGTNRLESYVRSRIELGATKPLKVSDLEDKLRLLKSDPLFDNIEASLKAGQGIGQSILEVIVTEAPSFVGNVGVDNYSPPSVGGERFNLNLGYRNLSGIGDSIAANYSPRFEDWAGTYQLQFSYQAPLNPMNGTIQLYTSLERNQVVEGDFNFLDISGESDLYQITYRQPLIRTTKEELALSFGFSYRDSQTYLMDDPFPFGFGPDDDGNTTTSVFKFTQEYTFREVNGAWGFRSQFNFGTGIFGATVNDSPTPDSIFFSWLAQIQRVQVINENNFLIAQFDLQLTPDELLPSEQFVIGGGQSVRGYRQNVRAGDNGLRLSLEDRIILVRNQAEEPVFTLAPFFDMGYVWNNQDNPNPEADERFIAGLGLGMIWQPINNMSIRLDYAPPLVSLDDRGDNIQDNGLYFSINYGF